MANSSHLQEVMVNNLVLLATVSRHIKGMEAHQPVSSSRRLVTASRHLVIAIQTR